ncbi:MAG: hypothetical protein ABWY02_08020 [Telluria sp.]
MNKMPDGRLDPTVGGDRIRRVSLRALADSTEIMVGLLTLWEVIAEPMMEEPEKSPVWKST